MIDTNPESNPSGKPAGHSFLGWLLIPLSLFPLAALMNYDPNAISALEVPARACTNPIGPLGEHFAYYGYALFGFAIWIVPFVCVVGGIRVALSRRTAFRRSLAWLLLGISCAACLIQVAENHLEGLHALRQGLRLVNAGGAVGYLLMDRLLCQMLSDVGASVVAGIGLAAAVVAGIGPRNIAAFFVGAYRWALLGRYYRMADGGQPDGTDAAAPGEDTDDEQARYLAALRARDDARAQREAEKNRIREEKLAAKEAARLEKEAERERIRAAREAARAAREAEVAAPAPERAPAAAAPAAVSAAAAESGATEPTEDKGPYILPPASLLAPLKTSVADHSDIGTTSQRLIDTLKLFGVDATMSYTVEGPVVTKYALMLAPGTRYSSVTNLQDNLKGALHAKSLRIEAPIPGEEAIGIEVPNLKPVGITFREIFESDAWKNADRKSVV